MSVSEVPHEDIHRGGKTVSFKITNLSGSPISAVAMKSDCVKKSDHEKFNKITKVDDTLTNYIDSDILISPGGSKEYRIGGAPEPVAEWGCTGEFQGALFQDGTSVGEPETLARIRQIRVFVAREVGWQIAALSESRSRRDRRSLVLDALDNLNQSAMDTARTHDERLSIDNVSYAVTYNLQQIRLRSGLPLSDDQRFEIILGRLRTWQQRLARVNGSGER